MTHGRSEWEMASELVVIKMLHLTCTLHINVFYSHV
jgi:hypothetical protein